MKRRLSLFLSLAIVLGVCLSAPFAIKSKAATVDDLTFELNDDCESYSIIECNESASGELVIPDMYNGLPVTRIGDGAFFDCSLTSVTIGDSVKTIGDHAFYDCYSLTTIDVSIDNNYYTSVDGVLFNKEKTKLIVYPAEKVGTVYIIPNSVISIGDAAFIYCYSLKTVIIPDSVTNIGEKVFQDCDDLVLEVFENTCAHNYALENYIKYKIITEISCLDFELNSDEGSYYVSGYKTCISGDVTIPETYNGLPVTSIGNYAFSGCDSLTNIIIPDSVISIGSSAFYDCIALSNIIISDSVTSIGYDSFYNTSYFNDSGNWESDVLYIGNHLIKANVSLSGDYVIKDGTKSIADYAFEECNSLTSITIPRSVTSIGDYVFEFCTSLTSVTIGDSVNSIGSSAFRECSLLARVNIPDSVIKIGDRAFYFCSSLTSVTLGNNIENIGDEAFYGCVKLPCITIPRSTNQIGYNAFINCHSLELINVSENNEIYASVDGVLYNKEKTMLIKYPQGKTLTQYVVPDTVTEIYDFAFQANESLISVVLPDSLITIGESAFNWCSSLVSIIIPNSVTSIESAAFCACKSLESVVLSNGLTNIEDSVFLGCDSLLSIEIPNSITNISDHAFDGCGSLESVTIGSGVISIEESAFGSCEKLSTIEVDENNLSYSSEDGILFNKEKTLIVQYPQGKIETAFTIPDSVNSIGGHAFSGCDSLTNITIPDSVISIGENAFVWCSSLTSVNIPCSVTSIGDYAFSNCASLTSITIPDSVTNIGNSAFYDTAYYNDCLNWENDVLYIGNHLIKAKETLSGDYIIKSGIKYIAPHTFYNCTLLTSIKIPDSVTTIGASAFEDCTALTSVTIPNSVTSIGNYAFSGCDSLAIATIGNSVTSIGDNAFVDYGESFEYIFYLGSREDWNNISIGVDNSGLSFATIHYNATGHSHSCSIESAPTEQENGKAIDTCPVCGFINGEEDIVYINNYITAVDTKNAVVDTTGNTLLVDMSACKDINEAIVEMDGYTVTTTTASGFGFIGTGSKLQVADSTGTQIAEYTLVVRGDVNGDSVCDALDLMLIELARQTNNNVTLEGAYFTAANLAEDSEINIDDFNAVVNKAVC